MGTHQACARSARSSAPHQERARQRPRVFEQPRLSAPGNARHVASMQADFPADARITHLPSCNRLASFKIAKSRERRVARIHSTGAHHVAIHAQIRHRQHSVAYPGPPACRHRKSCLRRTMVIQRDGLARCVRDAQGVGTSNHPRPTHGWSVAVAEPACLAGGGPAATIQGSEVWSRRARGSLSVSPRTTNQMFSAILVAWSPIRSMFLAMKSRCVQAVMLR